RDWSSDVCSSDLRTLGAPGGGPARPTRGGGAGAGPHHRPAGDRAGEPRGRHPYRVARGSRGVARAVLPNRPSMLMMTQARWITAAPGRYATRGSGESMAAIDHFIYGPITPILAYGLSALGSFFGLSCAVRARSE